MTAPSVQRLHALAAGLCFDADLKIAVHPNEWSWSPADRTLSVAADDLATLGSESCCGIIAHEVGHAWVTRYFALFDHLAPTLPPLLRAQVLNAFEDPRVELWVRRRYPGVARWLALAHGATRPRAHPGASDVLLFIVFAARGHHLGWSAPDDPALPEAVRDALARTAEARRSAAEDFLPPSSVTGREVDPALVDAWTAEVGVFLPATAPAPTRFERQLDVLSARATRRGVEGCEAIVHGLWRRDVRRIAGALGNDPVRIARAGTKQGTDAAALAIALLRTCVTEPADAHLTPEGQRVAEHLLDALLDRERSVGAGRLGASLPGGTIATPTSKTKRRANSPADPSQTDGLRVYREAFQRSEAQIHALTAHLERILVPRRRLAHRSGYATGSRLDVRSAMLADADRRRLVAWKRPNLPDRHSTSVSLLVDLSSSMRNGQIQAALQAAVVFVESLARVGVPCEVNGFQDVLIPLKAFHESLDDVTRGRLGEMGAEVGGVRPGGNNRPGYNDDGPCLREAGQRLLRHPAHDRVLVVVSDGLPEGEHSTVDDLRAAIAELSRPNAGVGLIGLGIGPHTRHVSEFYPRAMADVPVREFPEVVARLMARVLET